MMRFEVHNSAFGTATMVRVILFSVAPCLVQIPFAVIQVARVLRTESKYVCFLSKLSELCAHKSAFPEQLPPWTRFCLGRSSSFSQWSPASTPCRRCFSSANTDSTRLLGTNSSSASYFPAWRSRRRARFGSSQRERLPRPTLHRSRRRASQALRRRALSFRSIVVNETPGHALAPPTTMCRNWERYKRSVMSSQRIIHPFRIRCNFW